MLQKTQWLQSASELYRPSDRRLSAKLVPTFLSIDGGQRDESLRPYSPLSKPEPILFLPSSSSVVLTRLSGHADMLHLSQNMNWFSFGINSFCSLIWNDSYSQNMKHVIETPGITSVYLKNMNAWLCLLQSLHYSVIPVGTNYTAIIIFSFVICTL
jgi:hypothetical protein